MTQLLPLAPGSFKATRIIVGIDEAENIEEVKARLTDPSVGSPWGFKHSSCLIVSSCLTSKTTAKIGIAVIINHSLLLALREVRESIGAILAPERARSPWPGQGLFTSPAHGAALDANPPEIDIFLVLHKGASQSAGPHVHFGVNQVVDWWTSCPATPQKCSRHDGLQA